MRRTPILLALLAAAPLLAAAALPPRPPQDAPSPLRDRIDALVRDFKGARVGVSIRFVEDGRTVYANLAEEPFLLASNTKLLTTAAALCALGPDFRFRTAAGTAGGDLHVFGGGDPNISGRFHDDDPTAIFRLWAARLKDAGVTRVNDLVLHTGIFDDEHVNPGWDRYDPWFWWAAPFGALSLNDNCVDLKVRPGPVGEPGAVVLSPDTAYVTIANQTETAARPRRPFGFTRRAGTNTITLRGEIDSRAGTPTYSVTIHDPTMFFGAVLRETLAREGIAVSGAIQESPRPVGEVEGFRELAAHESDLPSTLAVCNRRSQNFYAEMILRTLGWKTRGRGTLENGLASVAGFLARDVGAANVSQADGSGLTRENRASPEDLVRLLLYMRRHRHAREFLESLPAAGMPETTLRNRMKDEDLRGRVRAKTGHLAGVSTLSGYAESQAGESYAFSILVNNERGSSTSAADRLQDRICGLLVRHKGD